MKRLCYSIAICLAGSSVLWTQTASAQVSDPFFVAGFDDNPPVYLVDPNGSATLLTTLTVGQVARDDNFPVDLDGNAWFAGDQTAMRVSLTGTVTYYDLGSVSDSFMTMDIAYVPGGLVYALGYQGHILSINPDTGLVSAEGSMDDLSDFAWAELEVARGLPCHRDPGLR